MTTKMTTKQLFDDDMFLETNSSTDDALFIDLAYKYYLKRSPEPKGKNEYLAKINQGILNRHDLIKEIRSSREFSNVCNKAYRQELMSSCSGIEFVFVHIPKTAGNTFNHVLDKIYGKETQFDDTGYTIEQIILNQLITPEYKVLRGHIPVWKYKNLMSSLPKAKIVTWLRNPIMRLISWYCFCISQPPEEVGGGLPGHTNQNKISFEEFIEHPEAQNAMHKQLDGMELTQYDFVGIVEFYKEDFSELKNMLSWPELPISSSNPNKFPGYKEFVKNILSNQKLVKKISHLNDKDIELYKEGIYLRSNRILKQKAGVL